MIKTFKRRIRKINDSAVVTIPKFLVESEGLVLGDKYDFIIKIPDKGNIDKKS